MSAESTCADSSSPPLHKEDATAASPEPGAAADSSSDAIAYLRERGVEIDIPGERRPPPAALPGAPEFEFVCIPADAHAGVSTERATAVSGDGLKALLAPRFADTAAMDEETVARETAAPLKGMLTSGTDPATAFKDGASAAAMQRAAAGGACEAYPLVAGTEENGWTSVRLYIDEVGALRGRPRNQRAEDLAAAAGLVGLSIHGDAYVGRCACGGGGGERNASFGVSELAHDSAWLVAARRANHRLAEQRGLHEQDELASGDQGTYSWTQTDDDLEVRGRPPALSSPRSSLLSSTSPAPRRIAAAPGCTLLCAAGARARGADGARRRQARGRELRARRRAARRVRQQGRARRAEALRARHARRVHVDAGRRRARRQPREGGGAGVGEPRARGSGRAAVTSHTAP